MILCKSPWEIEIMRKTERLSNISRAIQKDVEANHFSIIREYGGHGVGEELHGDPDVSNYDPFSLSPSLLP